MNDLPRVNGEDGENGALDAEEALAAAVRLLEEVLHLRMHGERAPGGNETWAELDPRIEAYLRSMHHRGDASCTIRPLHSPCHTGSSEDGRPATCPTCKSFRPGRRKRMGTSPSLSALWCDDPWHEANLAAGTGPVL